MSKQLKTLEQHNEQMQEYYNSKLEYNGIACPKCGEDLYDSNPMVILTSMPSQKNTACIKCDYTGYRIA